MCLLAPGCVSPPQVYPITEDTIDSEDTVDNSIPEFLNLIAETAARDIDRGDEMDILLDANGEKTMILWVSTGCSGCHDWTEFIANHMRDGNISNDTDVGYIRMRSPGTAIEVNACFITPCAGTRCTSDNHICSGDIDLN